MTDFDELKQTKAHRVYGFHQKYFTGGEEWRFKVPK